MTEVETKATWQYRLAWQACSAAFASAMTAVLYLTLHLSGTPDLGTGALCGACWMHLWDETRWREDDL